MNDDRKREQLHLLVEALEGEDLDLVLAIVQELLELRGEGGSPSESTDRVVWESATWGKTGEDPLS